MGPDNKGQTALLLQANDETCQRSNRHTVTAQLRNVAETRHTVTAQTRNVEERDQTHSYCTTTERGKERPDTQLLHNYGKWQRQTRHTVTAQLRDVAETDQTNS